MHFITRFDVCLLFPQGLGLGPDRLNYELKTYYNTSGSRLSDYVCMSEALVLLNDLLWLYQETQAIHHLSVLRTWRRLDLESAQPQCYGRNNVFLGVDNPLLLKLPPLLTRTSGLRCIQNTRMWREYSLLFENDLSWSAIQHQHARLQPFFSSHFSIKENHRSI